MIHRFPRRVDYVGGNWNRVRAAITLHCIGMSKKLPAIPGINRHLKFSLKSKYAQGFVLKVFFTRTEKHFARKLLGQLDDDPSSVNW
jgi:hypothetical protein